jgi:uncharacterized protein with FMN-binding domain
MRARAAFLAGAGSAALLAIGWYASLSLTTDDATSSVPAAASTSGANAGKSSTGASTPAPTASASSSASAEPAPAPVPVGPADGTYQGQAIGYEFGTVQVAVVIAGGQIVDVQNIVADATKGRGQAYPLLLTEVLQAQSANIANISGATYTTLAYAQAVQSALDAAGFTG